MTDRAPVHTGNVSEQFLHRSSCSHCTGATFETEQKPIRYSVNIALETRSEVYKAMFTLYRIGFCSVSKIAPVQCEQKLMFCCGAEIVPNVPNVKRSPIRHTIYNAFLWFQKIIYQNEVPLQFLLQ